VILLAKDKEIIFKLIRDHFDNNTISEDFLSGDTNIPVSGKVYGSQEVVNLVDAALEFWLTTGRYNEIFEEKISSFLNIPYVLTTNSGSSANLLAVSALTSKQLGEERLKSGDEVITVAAGFPTTVNPIIQNGLIPVFCDIEIGTYNIDVSHLEEHITEKTKAIVLAHSLGNPFNIETITTLAEKYNLWIVEDCCDAFGSTYKDLKVGSFGDIGTLSFYPAHHITTGEGGAVFTKSAKLKKIIESIRDWGRDCWCAPGTDNTCKKRFGWQLGELPEGYDHKYIYSHLGYNLKMTDLQASVGVAQMNRLEDFILQRKKNFNYLKNGLAHLAEFFILPEATQYSDPAWFGFPISIRPNTGMSRKKIVDYLNGKKIATRYLFGGNLTKQPYMSQYQYKIATHLDNTDFVMNQTFWIGVYPAINKQMLDYVIEMMDNFIRCKV